MLLTSRARAPPCAVGFINVLVRPLLSEWAGFLGAEAERDVIVTLEATLRLWETSGAKVIDSWGDFAVKKEAGSAEEGGAPEAAAAGGGKKGGHRTTVKAAKAAKQAEAAQPDKEVSHRNQVKV